MVHVRGGTGLEYKAQSIDKEGDSQRPKYGAVHSRSCLNIVKETRSADNQWDAVQTALENLAVPYKYTSTCNKAATQVPAMAGFC